MRRRWPSLELSGADLSPSPVQPPSQTALLRVVPWHYVFPAMRHYSYQEPAIQPPQPKQAAPLKALYDVPPFVVGGMPSERFYSSPGGLPFPRICSNDIVFESKNMRRATRCEKPAASEALWMQLRAFRAVRS